LPIALAKLDVDDDLYVSDAFDKVLTEYGRIDVLVKRKRWASTFAPIGSERCLFPGRSSAWQVHSCRSARSASSPRT
jgi:hypothetical protein